MQRQHDKEIEHLKETVNDMQGSLGIAMAEIADLKSQLNGLSGSERTVAAEKSPMSPKLEDLQKDLQQLSKQTDYLENQSRRNNLRIYGIPEDSGEAWNQIEKKCLDFSQTNLTLPPYRWKEPTELGQKIDHPNNVRSS